MDNQKINGLEKTMDAKDTVNLLSQTVKDVTERKITLRHAITITRVATALMKAIETADLNDRVEFLEQVLKKKK